MKKYLFGFIAIIHFTQPILAGQTTTFSVTIPYGHPSFGHPFEHKPKESKPEWKRFMGKYVVSIIAAASIGAITGLGSAEMEKRWVVQNGRSSELRWFINFIGSALVRWNLVNLINTGLEESDIPHDPAFISIGAWITDWACYLYRR